MIILKPLLFVTILTYVSKFTKSSKFLCTRSMRSFLTMVSLDRKYSPEESEILDDRISMLNTSIFIRLLSARRNTHWRKSNGNNFSKASRSQKIDESWSRLEFQIFSVSFYLSLSFQTGFQTDYFYRYLLNILSKPRLLVIACHHDSLWPLLVTFTIPCSPTSNLILLMELETMIK